MMRRQCKGAGNEPSQECSVEFSLYLWGWQDQFAPLLGELRHAAGLQDGGRQIWFLLLLDLLLVPLALSVFPLAVMQEKLHEFNWQETKGILEKAME